jgi:hypothetical protein
LFTCAQGAARVYQRACFTRAFLISGKRSKIAFAGMFISCLTIAFTSSSIFYDYDINPKKCKTAKEKEAVLSVMTWWYSQNYGCAITKALAKQMLSAVSFACSSRAAAKHTAKNANLKKTRASYYSGATADDELPFRISAKRAFHNGRPINGD